MKLKNILIALMMVIGTTLMAQEKYEQAIVRQVNGAEVQVSIEGQEFKLIKIKPMVMPQDFSHLLKEAAEMREIGWEIWNSTNEGNTITYFLRRKLK